MLPSKAVVSSAGHAKEASNPLHPLAALVMPQSKDPSVGSLPPGGMVVHSI